MTAILCVLPGAKKRRVETGVFSALGLRLGVIALGIPEKISPRCLRRLADRAGRELCKMGAGAAVFSEGFPLREYFLSRGIREASPLPLLAAGAGAIALSGARARERALLTARGADRNALRVFGTLARGFRYVCVDAPEGSMPSFAGAGARLGLAVERARPASGLRADAAVLLAPPSFPLLLPPECLLVRCCAGCDDMGGREPRRIVFSLPSALAFTPPPGVSAASLAALALDSGSLSPEDVKILSVT